MTDRYPAFSGAGYSRYPTSAAVWDTFFMGKATDAGCKRFILAAYAYRENYSMPSKRILPVIVIAQFFCTSLWFAGNAILPDLIKQQAPDPALLANLTSAVQLGFITGTLLFAIFTIADRFSPSLVFFVCAIIAAGCNLCIVTDGFSAGMLLCFRFLTGFFLAGIYPVGMKIASDYYQKGLGRSLGFLVGALVLGTAFPHLLKALSPGISWRYIVYTISGLSVTGGTALWLLVPDGPYRRKGKRLDLTAFTAGFKVPSFRSAAIGYFGHMWELYTFWAFVPVMLNASQQRHQATFNLPLMSFLIIACGSIACVASGLLSQRFGAKCIATLSLCLSCSCCLLSPFFIAAPTAVLIPFLFFWGLVVIADSPLFSTLVAQQVTEAYRGSSLTIVNCIGFSVTILSLQSIKKLSLFIDPQYAYMALAAGPVVGLIALLTPVSSRSRPY